MPSVPFPFTCPFCGRNQIITAPHHHYKIHNIEVQPNEFGEFGHKIEAISCANPECKKVTLSLELVPMYYKGGWWLDKEKPIIHSQKILPQSHSKVQPDYIPEPLRNDYMEACLIRDLSPKASATLSRRCLQGMIRDFCGITKGTLYKEIEELQNMIEAGTVPKGVSEDSVEAIDSIRKIGNIGAHMEKDINHIIDVEPAEAQVLIELIETLFEEWYVEKHKREQRFAKIKGIADQKLNKKVAKPST